MSGSPTEYSMRPSLYSFTRDKHMSKESSSSSSGGIGFCGLLTIVFITLKLTGHIDWSWWWVLSPLWIGFLIGAAVFVLGIAAVLFVAWLESKP